MFLVLWAHSFATIAELQWFSKVPSPLNGMVGGNHWDQWFSDGFGVRQPLETMVFDGCAPLVRRWNGYVPSSKSKTQCLMLTASRWGLEINWGLVGVWRTAGAPRLVSNLPVRGSFNTAAKPSRVHRSSNGILSARRFSKSVLKVLRGENVSGSGRGDKFWCFKTYWWIVGLASNMWAWSVDLSFFS